MRIRWLSTAIAMLATLALADPDEAWIQRAALPTGTRPLLILLIDESTPTTGSPQAAAAYDPAEDYGSRLPAGRRCDSTRIYWRRGPGAEPDCLSQSGLQTDAASRGFQCQSAQATLDTLGYYIAARATQWRGNASGYWAALRDGDDGEVECPADLALPGASPVRAAEIAWNASPHSDAYMFLAGNYLNYLRAQPLLAHEPIASLSARFSALLPQDHQLEVVTLPWRGVANAAGRAELEAVFQQAATDDAIFSTPCRPVTLALISAASTPEELDALLAPADSRADLPGAQQLRLHRLASTEVSAAVAAATLVTAALQHDAAVPAGEQISAAGLLVQDYGYHAAIRYHGYVQAQASERWLGAVKRHDSQAITSLDLPVTTARQLFGNLSASEFAAAQLALQALHSQGDPGLQAPLSVSYGADRPGLVLVASHDGLLQAFDAETGIERWAFLPRQLLPRLAVLTENRQTTVRGHGLDGRLVLHRHETIADGHINRAAGEHLWLFFGLGRGGAAYYALDLADPQSPQLLWQFDTSDAGAELESWGEPIVTRLRIAGVAQNAGGWVVMLPGGYDRRLDAPGLPDQSGGNSLRLLDALHGNLLWRAGRPGAGINLGLGEMTHSLASAPRALDLDGDGWMDRSYLVDVAGQLWRFEFQSGRPLEQLAEARRLAVLGDGQQRFMSTPDVAMLSADQGGTLALSLGSGWLARPRDESIVDQFYSLRDTSQMPATAPLTDSDLFMVGDPETVLPTGTRGWRLRLSTHGPGEKVTSSSVSYSHVLHFQTYRPLPGAASMPCGPPLARHRHYALDLRTGLPATAVRWPADEDEPLPATGWPAALRIVFPGPASCAGCNTSPYILRAGESLDLGLTGGPWRTSWRPLEQLPVSP